MRGTASVMFYAISVNIPVLTVTVTVVIITVTADVMPHCQL